jgi:outer membrane lipoprotein carrier protein
MLRFNPMARLLAVFCLAVAAASPAQEQSARQQLERFTAGLETLHAQFDQVRDQSLDAPDSPLALLTDPGRLEEQFEVREAGEASDLQLLELRSLDRESQFERILLGLRADRLELMVMEDAFGLRTELRFRDLRRNPQLDESLFRFQPPPGVDLIGDVPEGSRGP